MKYTFVIITLLLSGSLTAQQNIHDLNFLIGEWKVREDIPDKDWWEETTRVGQYVMDSTYIMLESNALSSSGKERTYRWYIHYNSKTEQFEMVSMFGNWHKIQFDLLSWDPANRALTIENGGDPGSEEYHERLGEMVFEEGFDAYVWRGENKYGDPDDPGIWRYEEKGTRIR